MTSPKRLQHIRLELARSKAYPNGSPRCGYEFAAPLDGANHIDVGAWKELREKCSVNRFWENEVDTVGRLVHRSGGDGGATWIFDYDKRRRDDDQAGYRFGSHAFVTGEYVTLRDQDSEHTFKIVSVEGARA